VLWFAHDKIYDRIHVVNEVYARGLTPMVMAQAVLAIDRQYGSHRQMQGIIDSASFADIGMGGGRANIMNQMGCRWQPSEKGVGSRIAGKAHIHERLSLKSDNLPGLRVFANCKNLIRTLPALPYSSTIPEDISAEAEGHAVDALRYGLSHKSTKSYRVRLPGL
jgi:hypothetical protein